MRNRRPHLRAVLFAASLLLIGEVTSGVAECVIETRSDLSKDFVKHLSRTCTAEERATQAIRADEIMTALQQGKAIDLAGVVIDGNLAFDELPVVGLRTIKQLPPAIDQFLTSRNVTDLRVITQPVSIRDSYMRGSISTKLKDGYLLALRSITMTGTRFEGLVDLSRTLFNAPVDWSDAVFLREGLFIQGLYEAPARFDRTTFGAHTRFHLAQFREGASFAQVRFNGLTEFLEVNFGKDADFAGSTFHMGTGFSGSRFLGRAEFSDTLFEREVYWLFTDVAAETSFRGASFRGVADFSDAKFQSATDFTRTDFAVDPLFQRTAMKGVLPSRGRDPRVFYAIAAGLAALTGALIWRNRSRR
jgi:uncharacterized protein YjbI with pentapeptide repeats